MNRAEIEEKVRNFLIEELEVDEDKIVLRNKSGVQLVTSAV